MNLLKVLIYLLYRIGDKTKWVDLYEMKTLMYLHFDYVCMMCFSGTCSDCRSCCVRMRCCTVSSRKPWSRSWCGTRRTGWHSSERWLAAARRRGLRYKRPPRTTARIRRPRRNSEHYSPCHWMFRNMIALNGHSTLCFEDSMWRVPSDVSRCFVLELLN